MSAEPTPLQRLMHQALPELIERGEVDQVEVVVAVGVLALVEQALHPDRTPGPEVDVAVERVIAIALAEAGDEEGVDAVASFCARAFANNRILLVVNDEIVRQVQAKDDRGSRDARRLLGADAGARDPVPEGPRMSWLAARIDATKKKRR